MKTFRCISSFADFFLGGGGFRVRKFWNDVKETVTAEEIKIYINYEFGLVFLHNF